MTIESLKERINNDFERNFVSEENYKRSMNVIEFVESKIEEARKSLMGKATEEKIKQHIECQSKALAEKLNCWLIGGYDRFIETASKMFGKKF